MDCTNTVRLRFTREHKGGTSIPPQLISGNHLLLVYADVAGGKPLRCCSPESPPCFRPVNQVYCVFFSNPLIELPSPAKKSLTFSALFILSRSNFKAFVIYCALNVFVYCFPAHWMWGPNGWLKALGAKDVAGAGAVHAMGGASG